MMNVPLPSKFFQLLKTNLLSAKELKDIYLEWIKDKGRNT